MIIEELQKTQQIIILHLWLTHPQTTKMFFFIFNFVEKNKYFLYNQLKDILNIFNCCCDYFGIIHSHSHTSLRFSTI